MKALIVIVFFFAISMVTISATEENGSDKAATPSTDSRSGFYGYDIFKPRPTRWQSRMKHQVWLGDNPNPIRSGITETDPDYYPKLFNWLDKVGRR